MGAPACVVGGRIVPLQSGGPAFSRECPRGHGEKHRDCQCFFHQDDPDGVCMRLLFNEHPLQEVFADS
jgi:hypothetical protein